uniref:Glutenin, low molecular weight subunit n=1 Tax=Rhabditophanes sp. KR3021 TaxID=114890 RepID=A0AC35TLI7_9BILA
MDLLNLKTSGSVPPAGPATNSTSSATHDNASKSSTTSKEESGSKSMGTSYHGSISASNSNSNLASKSVGSVPSQPAPSPMNVATQDSNSMPYNSQMPQQGSANPQLSGFNNHPQNTPYNQSTGNLPMNSQQQQAHYQNTMQMRGNVGGMQGNMPLNQQSHQMQRQKSQSGFAPQRPGMTPQQLQQQQQQQQQQMLMRNQTGGPNIPYNQPNMQQQMGRPANQQVFDTSPENMQKMAHVHDRIKKAGTEEEKERIFAELKVNPSMMSQYLMYTEHEKKQNSYAGGRSMQPGPGNQPNWNAQVNQRMPMNHGQQPPQHNPGQYQQNMNNSQWQGQNYHNRGN